MVEWHLISAQHWGELLESSTLCLLAFPLFLPSGTRSPICRPLVDILSVFGLRLLPSGMWSLSLTTQDWIFNFPWMGKNMDEMLFSSLVVFPSLSRREPQKQIPSVLMKEEHMDSSCSIFACFHIWCSFLFTLFCVKSFRKCYSNIVTFCFKKSSPMGLDNYFVLLMNSISVINNAYVPFRFKKMETQDC